MGPSLAKPNLSHPVLTPIRMYLLNRKLFEGSHSILIRFLDKGELI